MLMDIETGNIEKKEKQPKPKKTYGQKRLIAGQIAMYCITGAVVAMLPGFIAKYGYDKDIRVLDNEQTAIYEEFMASEEFSDSFKQEFTKTSNDYANGLISYEEFDEKVKHLNSVKYAQEILASSSNTELKVQAEEIDQKKEERREEYNSNLVTTLSLGTLGVGTAACVGFTIASGVYSIKEYNEEKRKRTSNKIKHVLIDKEFTYYVYDHKETKTPNTIEEESNEDTLTK